MKRSFYLFVLLTLGLVGANPVFAQSEESDVQPTSCEEIYFQKHIVNYDEDKAGGMYERTMPVLPLSSAIVGQAAWYFGIVPLSGGVGIMVSPLSTLAGTTLIDMTRNDENNKYVDTLQIIREAKVGDGFLLRDLFDSLNIPLDKAKEFVGVRELADFIVDQDSQLAFCQNGKTLTYSELRNRILELRKEK